MPDIRIQRLEIGPQAQELHRLFAPFSPPEFACCLLGQQPHGIERAQLIAIGAYVSDRPAALLLASILPVLHFVEIHSLYVEPIHRNQSIAHYLLEQLEQELPTGIKYQLLLLYPLQDPSTPAVQKILRDLHWNGAQPFMTRCRFEAALFHPPWLDMPVTFSEGLEEFFWKELSQEDMLDLKNQVRQGHFPRELSPFHDSNMLEPLNSLGLRYQGKIIGWCVTHRVAPDTIRYSSFFINRNFRSGRAGMKLLIDSIRLHKQSPVKWALIEVPLLLVDPSWTRFVEKHLVPYAESVTHIVQAWKSLG